MIVKMTQRDMALEAMRQEDIKTSINEAGKICIVVHGFHNEISDLQEELWAKQYLENTKNWFEEESPLDILEEIARIFHYRGWDLGNSSSQDKSFIESSDRYLELVYNRFYIGKK